MLDDQLKTQLAAYLERVTQPFELVASLDDSETAAQMRELLTTIQGLRSDKISLRPYRRDRLAVVVPQSHALARKRSLQLTQVIEHDLIGMHADSALNHLITRAAADQGLQPRLRMKVTGYDALCLMVASGLGIGILPEGSARIYMGTLPLKCIRLDETWAERQLMLCVRSQDALSPVAQLLVEHLCQSTEQDKD